MSKLIYDGGSHTIELIGCDAKSLGKWPAYNNIDSAYAKQHYGLAAHLANGTYTTLDYLKPHAHVADANGPYGSYGIIRFNYPGHPGVGVHSGRAHWKHNPGPQHATHGCIRTTDAAMQVISATMKTDALASVTVQGNNAAAAQHGEMKSAVQSHVH